jgi:hypothetical protein
MLVDWQKYSLAYKNAPAEIKEIIDSNLILNTFDSLVGKGVIGPDYKTVFVIAQTHILLNLIPRKAAEENLKTETTLDETKIIEVLNLFNPELSLESTPELVAEINEMETTLKETPHIRTMAQDMSANQDHEELVYTSTQAAILGEAKPKTEVVGSWGSETK